MTAKEKFIKFLNWFESLFMTNHSCICCGKEILDGTAFQLCDKCKSSLSVINGDICKKCGEMVIAGNNICDHCKTFKYNFSTNVSFCYYDDVSSKIVKGLKYNRRKYYAKHIAEMMCKNKEIFENVDYLTYVPVSKKRAKERGFNQAKEIASEISKLVGIEVIDVLEKSNDKKHQAGLKRKERLQNLKGSFNLIDKAKDKINKKTILIIDDVFTTGATLNECALEIKKFKPKQIKTYTFAKTKLEHKNNDNSAKKLV